MKIAHLISTYLPVVGGAQVCIHNIAQRHAKKHDVVVIVPRQFKDIPTGDYKKEGLWPATLFLFKANYPLGKWYLEQQIHKLQTKYRFDLWQVTIGYPLGVAAVDYFKKNNIPCVLRCSGEDIQVREDVGYGVRRNKKADTLIRKNYKKFDEVVAISQAMNDDYLKIGVAPEMVTKIPNGVDIKQFETARWQAKKKLLDIPESKKVILTVGRNHPKKGFHLIPHIIDELLKQRQDFVWVMVGDGNEAIIKSAQKKGKRVSAHLKTIPATGLQSKDFEYPSRELVAIYDAADIFAFPTFIETFGIVVIEAMAAGLPIVTTNAPGVNELVEQDVTGLKSPVGDVPSMVANLNRLLDDAGLYQRLKANVIEQSFAYDWNRIAESYLTLYQNVIESKGRGKN